MPIKWPEWESWWGKPLTKEEQKKFKQEQEEWDALDKTGFYGVRAAGCLPVAVDTKKFLFAKRSEHVQEPNTWALWGGAIGKGESPIKGAIREFKEEAQYIGKILKVYPLAVYSHESGFKYFSYLIFIPSEFKPHLNFETTQYVWCDYDEWPTPLHPKVRMLLNGFKVDSILQEIGIRS